MMDEIRLKRIYDPVAADDGVRLLVDRLWPRGVTKEAAALTAWLREVAPSAELRHWFGHDPKRWAAFTRRYRAELHANDAAVSELRSHLGQGKVTLLYGARDQEHNHALVLADYLHELEEDGDAN